MGVDMGMVMEINLRKRDAPSISAASYMPLSMFLNAESHKIMPLPVLHRLIKNSEAMADGPSL